MQDLKVKSGVLPKALEIRYALIKVSLVDNLRGQNLIRKAKSKITSNENSSPSYIALD